MMDTTDIQRSLRALGFDPDVRPAILDAATKQAVDALLEAQKGVIPHKWWHWDYARREIAAEQIIIRDAGIEVGEIDGLIGPQTRFAFEAFDHLEKTGRLPAPWRDEPDPFEDDDEPVITMRAPTAMAFPRQASVSKFYGDVGKNQAMLDLPFPMQIAWDKTKIVRRISLHEKVVDSARRVFERIADAYDEAKRADLGLNLFSGALNVRKMRGGTAWSMHSWGIAIDFDDKRNQLKWGRDKARLARPDAERFWQLWKEEGWLSLGQARNYDWMHVQAARL